MPYGCELIAGYHDFHVKNLTPSVTLLTEIMAYHDGNGELPSLYEGNKSVYFGVFSLLPIDAKQNMKHRHY